MGTSTPNMSDRRLIEAGRLCLVNYGPLTGKLCVIVNVVSSKMVLVDGPTTGVSHEEEVNGPGRRRLCVGCCGGSRKFMGGGSLLVFENVRDDDLAFVRAPVD